MSSPTPVMRSVLTLTTVACAAATCLFFCHAATQGAVEKQQQAALLEALRLVLPMAAPAELVERGAGEERYWRWQRDGQILGYAYLAAAPAYSSVLRFMVGVDAEGAIVGLRVLYQAETPGLGARMQEAASHRTLWQAIVGTGEGGETGAPARPWFELMFEGLRPGTVIAIRRDREWTGLSDDERAALRAANAVTAISGATISTRAACDAVRQGFERIQAREAEQE